MPNRFHVLLDDHQYRFLTDESERASVSVAELIRRAIDATYRLDEKRRTPGVELSLALWRRPDAGVLGRRSGITLKR